MRARLVWCLLLLAALLSPGWCASPPTSVRVALGRPCDHTVKIAVSGAAAWSATEGRRGADPAFTVELCDDHLLLVIPNDRRLPLGQRLEIMPQAQEELSLDGKPCPGTITITPGDGGLQIVSAVDVEDYVAGLLPSQAFDTAPVEAVKAQAVALRTWVMRDLGLQANSSGYKHHRQNGFDFCTDAACCRSYQPGPITLQVAAAVRQTRGQVLTYQGNPILACFDSNAGGRTENIDSAWPGNAPRDYPYLCTVDSASDQRGAAVAHGYSGCWQWSNMKVRAADIEGRLQRRFKEGVGEPTKLVVRSRSDSGRVREMEVVGTNGRMLVAGSDLVRIILGVPSALLDSDVQVVPAVGGAFTVSGRGQGSGVGMSEHGALGMARAGSRCEEILGHYYPGVALTEELGTGTSRVPSPAMPNRWDEPITSDTDQPLIRVGLHYGAGAVDACTVSGGGRWESQGTEETFSGDVLLNPGGAGLTMTLGERHLKIGAAITFRPAGQPWLELRTSQGAWRYRGLLRIEREGDRLRIVNELPFEDYVRGVIPNEIFSLGGSEVFKVQAVTSRTFALYWRQHGRHRQDGFDVCATGLCCQEYRGYGSESSWADEAVRETQGQVLTQNGSIILAAYHDNAGGQTDTPYGVGWTEDPGYCPYLRSVPSPQDDSARLLPGYEWCYAWDSEHRPGPGGYSDTTVLTGSELRKRVKELPGADVGPVRDVVVQARTESGRIRVVDIVGENGTVTLRGADTEVRRVLRTPSAMVTSIAKVGDSFLFSGRGRAHGVGLSQHGAMGLALRCYSYDQILAHYYQGVRITARYGGEQPAIASSTGSRVIHTALGGSSP